MGELWIVPWFGIEGTPESLDLFMKEVEDLFRNEVSGNKLDPFTSQGENYEK